MDSDQGSMEKPVPAEATFPGRPESIPEMVGFVGAFATKKDFTEVRLKEIGLALEEALNNIINYSCDPANGEISFYCTVNNAGQLVIAMSDRGKPFNMLLAADPFLEPDFPGMKRPSTRKIFKYASTVEYKRHEGRNVLTFFVSRIPVGS